MADKEKDNTEEQAQAKAAATLGSGVQESANAKQVYKLKKGAEHYAVISGEAVTLRGDDGDSVELTRAQYEAFRDKFVAKAANGQDEEEDTVAETGDPALTDPTKSVENADEGGTVSTGPANPDKTNTGAVVSDKAKAGK